LDIVFENGTVDFKNNIWIYLLIRFAARLFVRVFARLCLRVVARLFVHRFARLFFLLNPPF
jgi:hypothetical protein